MIYTAESIAMVADNVRAFLVENDKSFEEPPLLEHHNNKAQKAIEILGGRLKYFNKDELWNPNWGIGKIVAMHDDTKTKFEISLPRYEPPQKDAFIIAHELGHLFVHLKYTSNEWLKNEEFFDKPLMFKGRNIIEYEADFFAYDFLLPKKLLQEKIRDKKFTRVELAGYFGVEQARAEWRINFLREIVWGERLKQT